VRVSGPDIPGHEKRYKLLYPFLSPFIRLIWRGAEVTIAKCRTELDRIMRIEPYIKGQIIPNGVHQEEFQTNSSNNIHDDLRLLCVGRLIEHKGQRYLIEVVKMLRDEGINVTLDLVGTGDALERYQLLTRKLNITDSVRFLGYIPRENIAEYYHSADVFVLSSYNEGMSLAILEAMSAGLPILVTRDRGDSELIIEGNNGFTFPFGDLNYLSNLIRQFVNNRKLIIQMGESSRIFALNYSWKRSINLYFDLIESVIDTRDPS
jgi:phosphatidyl-myo-inositol dimannoside synthase